MALQLRRGTNAERLSITPAQGELIFVTDYLAVNITATTIASNLITFSSAHNLVVGQKLLYLGVTQNGLTQGTIYYVIALGLTTTACKLSTSLDGTAVTLTDGTELNLIFNKSPTNQLGTPVGNVSPLWIGNGSTVGGISAQVSVLDDLLDVTLTSLEEGNTLYYDATAGQWKNNNILTIDDTTNSKNIIVTTNATNLFSATNSNTDLAYSPIELRSSTSATPTLGFGSSILYSANNLSNELKYLGSAGFSYSDLTSGSEDSEFRVKLLKAGESPVGYASYLDQFVVQSDGDILAAKDLTLNKDRTFNIPRILFNNTTKDGSLSWTGSGFFGNGDLDLNKGADGTVNITTGSVGAVTTTTANLFCNSNIGTINIGNLVSTELKLGNVASGTLTTVNSPTLKLLGDIIVVGNDIKSGASGNPTAITLNNTDVSVIGDLTVTGNSIKSSNATAIELSSSDVTVVGDLTVQGNHIRSSTGVNTIELSASDVTVKGDLTILGDNGGTFASINTTKTAAELFTENVSELVVGYNATDITVGATTGTTTIRNNAVVGGDLTVTGGDITTGVSQKPLILTGTNNNTNLSWLPLDVRSITTATAAVGHGSGTLYTANNAVGTVKNLGYTVLSYTDITSGSEDADFRIRLLKDGMTPLEPESTTADQLILNSLGDLQITGDLTVTGNDIKSSTATALTLAGADVTVAGNLTVAGNQIKHSNTTTQITLATNGVVFAGNIQVNGNNVQSSTGEIALTLAGADVTVAGNLKLGNNTILSTNGTTAIQTTSTGDIIVGDDIFSRGNVLQLNYGTTGTPTVNAGIEIERGDLSIVTLRWNESTDRWEFTNNGTNYTNLPVATDTLTYAGLTTTGDITVGGNLTVNGTTTTINSTTLTVDDKNIELGSVTTPTDVTAQGGGITLKGATDKTIIWNNSTDGFEVNQALKTTGRINVNDKIFLYANTGDLRTTGDAYIGSGSIWLNDAYTGSTPTQGASLLVQRGTLDDAFLSWNETTDKWNTSHSLIVTGDLTSTGDLTVSGDSIKKSGGTEVITFSGTNLTTFAGDIKLGGNSIYDSAGNNALDLQSYSTIYGTSYQAKFNTAVNYGIGASYLALDNIVEMNTSRLTTTSTAVAVLDYFDKTVYRSAKYLIQISNGTAHQIWEGMVIHDGTNIFVTGYGDLRTNNNLATISVGFNGTTGYAELQVTPVNATETKFKATKTYIVV